MSEEPVRTPGPSLTIRKALTEEKRNKFFYTLIQTATTDDDYKALKDLLNTKDHSVNHMLNISLMIVSELGNIETVKFLIDNGADVNTQDEKGKTALMIASEMNDMELVKLLIEKGADIDKRDKVDKSAFLYARDSKANAIRKLLMDKGALLRPSRLNKRGGARTRRRSRKSKGTRRR